MNTHIQIIQSKKEYSKANLSNIKSYYILRIVFAHMKRNKFLSIIKYNKKIQIRQNINLIDYKNYSLLFDQIEIELIPAKNKYSTFITINEEEKP